MNHDEFDSGSVQEQPVVSTRGTSRSFVFVSCYVVGIIVMKEV